MTGQARTDHLGYIEAVVRELESWGVSTGKVFNLSTGSRCAADIAIPGWADWPWCEPIDVSAYVQWDEKHGWTVVKVFEISGGSGRGRGETCYSLGLGPFPDPDEVALHVVTLFESGRLP